MNYEVGKQYEMRVVGIQKDSAGFNFIALHDDDPSKEYRVYNILKCQWDGLPDTLYVVVKSIDEYGRLKLRQDEGRLFQEHYITGKLYAFEVLDVKEDFNSGKPYYLIEDDFAAHHYYFQGEQKYNVGEDCILEVAGFTDKGFLKLKEVEHYDGTSIEKPVEEKTDNTENELLERWNGLPVLNVGEESQTLELKTSIAFPPGKGEPDIDRQLYNILKELTAFMNTDGGTLYIGVHDKSKKVIGIEGDYKYLNDGEDEYNGSYNANVDGYQLKIRNTMDKLCPTMANSLTTISFEDLEGNTYCKIDVKPAKRPIFLSGTQLFVRQGNRLKLLKGEDITMFIYERMTISIKEVLDTDDIQMSPSTLDIDVLKQVVQNIVNERKVIPRDLPKPKDLGEVDYWIIWYQDGTWKRARQQSSETNAYIQVPIYKSISDPVLAFCYESGRINVVSLADFRKKANLNKIQDKGWSKLGEKPKNIFAMHRTDFLIGYSIDCNAIEYVKAHAISDYTTSASAENPGRPFLPETNKIKAYAVLGAEHKRKIEHLIVTKAARTKEAGTPLESPTFKDEIEYLEKVLMGKL